MEIDYNALSARLCLMDMTAALVDYIFKVQGGSAKRLDYNAAARTLGCCRRTVGRGVQKLIDNGILQKVRIGKDYGVQICPDLVTAKD